MNKKVIKYISSLSIICAIGVSLGLGINEINKNNSSLVSSSYTKIIGLENDNNIQLLSSMSPRAGETTVKSIDIPSNLSNISAQEALANNDSTLKALLKNNAFENLPSNATVTSFQSTYSNKAGIITISSITVSDYNDSTGSPTSTSKTFPTNNVRINGFHPIGGPTEGNTKVFTWDDNSKTVYDVNETNLLTFFNKNKNQALKNTVSNTKIVKVNINQLFPTEGKIKLSLVVNNLYKAEGNDFVLKDEGEILGFEVNGFLPTEDRNIASSNKIEWWVWLAIGLGAALLIILLIVMIILIIKKKKKEELQRARTLNRTVNPNNNSRLALSNGSNPNNQQNRLGNNSTNGPINNQNNRPGQAQPNQGQNSQKPNANNNNDPTKKPTPQQPNKPVPPPPPPIKVNAPPKSLAPKRVVKK